MAPDVEMRLSFPKKSPSVKSQKPYRFPSHERPNYFNTSSRFQRENGSVDNYMNGQGGQPALLPPTNNLNPKRSLSRNILAGIFGILRSHRIFNSSSLFSSLSVLIENHFNLVNNNNSSTKRLKDCNLPDLKQQPNSNRNTAKQTAKRTIKVFKRINYLDLLY